MKQYKKSSPVSPQDVTVQGSFWKQYMQLIKQEVIPYQWRALNNEIEGEDQNGCMHNFRVAAGLEEGPHIGMVFQDSDFSKWIEAVAYCLMWERDGELEALADEAIDTVVKAQQPDGYLNTHYIINGLENRFTNLMNNHELYCLGHMIEAAVAYYEATKKDKLLRACERYLALVNDTFGPEEGKLQGYPGHEVIEMALSRLHDVTGNELYLRMARYFIDQRGKKPLYFDEECAARGEKCHWLDGPHGYQYYQAGKPVLEQTAAEGHAVRAVYLYSGMADLARKTGDRRLYEACQTLWNNIVQKQMYITGGIGSTSHGEGFTYEYDLPNDTIYAETCASIGLVFFARRMLEIRALGEYADVMERALYNGILSGMSLDGKRFFYVNPLEVSPKASERDYLRKHVKVERQSWFPCACCPPNLARMIASIGSYAWGEDVQSNTLYMHLYIGGSVTPGFHEGGITVSSQTNYPWSGDVAIQVQSKREHLFTLALRIPVWARKHAIAINGEPVHPEVIDGYAYITRQWKDGDRVMLSLPMAAECLRANPLVRENIGKAAVVRGPIVYCLEQADNGENLHLLSLGGKPAFKEEFKPDLLGGIVSLESEGLRACLEDWPQSALYSADIAERQESVPLKWIPYYAWANRGPGEMLVWVRE